MPAWMRATSASVSTRARSAAASSPAMRSVRSLLIRFTTGQPFQMNAASTTRKAIVPQMNSLMSPGRK
jgi:hypothetical protein